MFIDECSRHSEINDLALLTVRSLYDASVKHFHSLRYSLLHSAYSYHDWPTLHFRPPHFLPQAFHIHPTFSHSIHRNFPSYLYQTFSFFLRFIVFFLSLVLSYSIFLFSLFLYFPPLFTFSLPRLSLPFIHPLSLPIHFLACCPISPPPCAFPSIYPCSLFSPYISLFPLPLPYFLFPLPAIYQNASPLTVRKGGKKSR